MMFKSVRFQTPKDGGGSTEGTPAAGSVPVGTPTPGAADAGQKKFEEELAKRDRDINNLKSSLQKQMSDQQRKWDQDRQQLEDELRKAQMATLDDDEKKEFKRNLEVEQAGQWKTKAQETEQRLLELQAEQNYKDFFIAKGVPTDKLVTGQGLEALVNSGWQGIDAAMTSMREELKQYKETHMTVVEPTESNQTSETPTPQRTPVAATDKPAGSGPTWPDLIKTYGSAEEVYRMVEAQELPPSIIPLA